MTKSELKNKLRLGLTLVLGLACFVVLSGYAEKNRRDRWR